MKLYRPVGLKEMELIAQLQFKAYPPRLVGQPIFYPVLNFDYAAQIARDWNTKDIQSDYMGLVTAFEVSDSYVAQFEVKNVGGRGIDELWVPAEQLDEFNAHIIGEIDILRIFYGAAFNKEFSETLKARIVRR